MHQKKIDIAYSGYSQDLLRLYQADGKVATNENGELVYRFDSKEKLEDFLYLVPKQLLRGESE